MLLKKLKRRRQRSKQISQQNSEAPTLMAHEDFWAIDACVSGREPWEDTCLKCGKCGRFGGFHL